MLAGLRRVRLNRNKLSLIDRAFTKCGARSFADLGGVWRVEGGYSFYTADKYKPAQSYLVDTHPTEVVQKRSQRNPRVQIVQGSFGDPAVAARVKGVDAVFFFDVLLHQVRPNWDEVLTLYGETPVIVIYNQQWTGAETVRLLELGEEEYFRNVPHLPDEYPYAGLFSRLDTPHPDYSDRKWREVHHVWQWGISDRDLLQTLFDLGYKLEFFENYGRFMTLDRFEDHGMILTKT